MKAGTCLFLFLSLLPFPISFPGRKTKLAPETNTWFRNFHGLSSWVTGHAQCCHHEVTYSIAVATVLSVLYDINTWWKRHSLHNVSDAILSVAWLIYQPHRRGGHSTNFRTAVTCTCQTRLNHTDRKIVICKTPKSRLLLFFLNTLLCPPYGDKIQLENTISYIRET